MTPAAPIPGLDGALRNRIADTNRHPPKRRLHGCKRLKRCTEANASCR